jgi:hypothetical protein
VLCQAASKNRFSDNKNRNKALMLRPLTLPMFPLKDFEQLDNKTPKHGHNKNRILCRVVGKYFTNVSDKCITPIFMAEE